MLGDALAVPSDVLCASSRSAWVHRGDDTPLRTAHAFARTRVHKSFDAPVVLQSFSVCSALTAFNDITETAQRKLLVSVLVDVREMAQLAFAFALARCIATLTPLALCTSFRPRRCAITRSPRYLWTQVLGGSSDGNRGPLDS